MPTTNDTARRIATAVSTALRDAGIDQRTAAAHSGIPIVTLSRRLTGKSPLNADELCILAELLKVPVSELVARAERAA